MEPPVGTPPSTPVTSGALLAGGGTEEAGATSPYPAYPTFQAFISFCNQFVIPIMIITGIVGNILTFLVFVLSPLKRNSTSVYLAALALTDSGFLFSLGAGWLENLHLHFFDQEPICTILVYVTYMLSFLSVWFVVCFTTVMYLTLFHKKMAALVNQPTKARAIVLVLTGASSLIYLHTFWTTKQITVQVNHLTITHLSTEGKQTCGFVSDEKVRMGLSIMDTMLTLIVPFSLLIFMNTRILVVIVRFSKKSGNPKTGTGTEVTSTSCKDTQDVSLLKDKDHQCRSKAQGEDEIQKKGHDGKQNKVGSRPRTAMGNSITRCPTPEMPQETGDTCGYWDSEEYDADWTKEKKRKELLGNVSKMQQKSFKMLLTVAIVFLVFNLPSHAARLQGLVRSIFTPTYVTSELEHLCQQLFQLLFYFNFIANFIIYNVCAKNFRTAFLNLPVVCSKACSCSCSCKSASKPKASGRVAQELRRMREEQNSRLVEVNLDELHISMMDSFGPDFRRILFNVFDNLIPFERIVSYREVPAGNQGVSHGREGLRVLSALSWATQREQLGVIKELLDRGADRNKKHTDGLTAIDLARGKDEIVWLFEGKPVPEVGAGDAASGTGAVNLTSPKQGVNGTVDLRYGDLEVFLYGLDLGQFLEVFRAHHVDFALLLTFTEEDLVNMGITQVGVRKKIMEGVAAVHKRNWESSSLVPIRVKSEVRCADAVAIVANLSKHLRYISSSVTYIKDHLQRNADFLATTQDGSGPKQLLLHTGDGIKNISTVQQEMQTLYTILSKVNFENFNVVIFSESTNSRGTKLGMLID
nr:hypothetical protein BaRGS_026231 [Batillaria attramentaria]